MKQFIYTFIFLFSGLILPGQELIKNIDRVYPGNSEANPLITIDDTLFFSTSYDFEMRLWKMNINDNEPILVKSFDHPNSNNYIQNVTYFKEHLYFTFYSESYGSELWVSDGTSTGTKIFKNICPGSASADPKQLLATENYLFFLASPPGADYHQLWATDGLSENTSPVMDTTLFYDYWYYIKFQDELLVHLGGSTLYKVDNSLEVTPAMDIPGLFGLYGAPEQDFFVAKIFENGEAGLWINHGLDSLSRFFTYNELAYFQDVDFVHIDNTILFMENGEYSSLWTSNGTLEGTIQLQTFPYLGFYDSLVKKFFTIGNHTYLYLYDNHGDVCGLWKTDLTPEGTEQVLEICSNSITQTESDIFYTEYHEETGLALWQYDGTNSPNPIFDADISACKIGTLFASDSTLFFNYSNGLSGEELWRFNIPSEEIVQVRDFNETPIIYDNGTPNNLRELNGKIFLIAGGEIWETDGSEEGTQNFQGRITHRLHTVGDSLLMYNLKNCAGQAEIWKTDGTSEGTSLLKEIYGHTSNDFLYYHEFTDKTYMERHYYPDPNSIFVNIELWETDGTSNGTQLKTTISGPGTCAGQFTKFNNELYYINGNYKLQKINPATGQDIWVTDLLLGDPGDGLPGDLKAIGDYLYFRKWATGFFGGDLDGHLWRTEGTDETTKKLVDLNFWPDLIKPITPLATVNDRFIFLAENQYLDQQLWVSDNTVAGTHLLKDFTPGENASTIILEPFYLNNIPYFFIQAETSTLQIWTTDGTVEGTILVKDLLSMVTPWIHPRYIFDNKLYIPLTSTELGTGLWVCDGTTEGTKLLFSTSETSDISIIYEIISLNNLLILTGKYQDLYKELWKYDLLTGVLEPLHEKQVIFEIFPNPVNQNTSKVFINSKLSSPSEVNMNIFNLQGKLLHQIQQTIHPGDGNELLIPANLSPGVYLINLIADGISNTLKITVQ